MAARSLRVVAANPGPPAGYFSRTSSVPLRIEPITPADDIRWPMAFAISMAVRRGDAALRDRINAALDREQPMVDAILRSYGVPLSASRLSPIIP